jgi:hypothetical protein
VALLPRTALNLIFCPPAGALPAAPGALFVNTLLTCPNDICDPVAGNVAISFSAAFYLTASFPYSMKNGYTLFIRKLPLANWAFMELFQLVKD